MGELNDLAASVAALLKQRGDSLAVSESSCGGLISAALVSIPGASDYYVGRVGGCTRGWPKRGCCKFQILRWKASVPAPSSTRCSTPEHPVRLWAPRGAWQRPAPVGRRAIVTETTPGTPALASPARWSDPRRWKPAAAIGKPICGSSRRRRWLCWKRRSRRRNPPQTPGMHGRFAGSNDSARSPANWLDSERRRWSARLPA